MSKREVISILVAMAMIGVSFLGGCSTLRDIPGAVQMVSFDEYRDQTLKRLRETRKFQQADTEAELQWNAPQEWRPMSGDKEEQPKKGILLVHGLGDSPWSFHDMAQELAAQGFLVRTVLLPGHGTRPDDLITVTAEQWQKVVYEQAQALEKDVDGQVYLGGFSTGANLVLEYAYSHPEIAGLLLVSPGFKSFPFDWLAPPLSWFRPWIITPGDDFPFQTPVRYMNVPTNGYAQFYRTSAMARRLLEHPYEKPVFMVVAQHDSVIDTGYLLDVFQRRFTNSRSRLIWYGEKSEKITDTKRILIREDRLPAQRISQFSHMGLMFSPDNPLYGSEGSQRICLNSMNKLTRGACEQGALVWYSDWGYHEEGKVHARLTFNPYFGWQTSVMLETLGHQEIPLLKTTGPTHDSKILGNGEAVSTVLER